MATFSKSSFNSAAYLAFRPTYPQEIYDAVFDFHKLSPNVKYERAIDVGCGTGQATFELERQFKHVTGVDPSENMINTSREIIQSRKKEGNAGSIIDFVQGSAEKLDFLSDDCVDLVIAAEACQYFDWSKSWPELARVTRKGATVAFWTHSLPRFPQYPTLTPLITEYGQGTDPSSSLGPYAHQPGWSLVVNHLVGIPEPNDVVPGTMFEPLERRYFTGAYCPEFPFARPVVMRKVMSWENFLEYLRTWSSLYRFKEQNSRDADHPEGPVEVRFLKALKEEASRAVDGPLPDEVEVEWPLALVLTRKVI